MVLTRPNFGTMFKAVVSNLEPTYYTDPNIVESKLRGFH